MRHALTRRARVAGAIVGLAGLAAALGFAAAPAATAAPAAARFHWARVTSVRNDIIDDVGLVRGGDGVLHVLWTTDAAAPRSVIDTPIGPRGAVLRPTVITKFFLTTDPDAAITSAGLTVAWNGDQTGNPHSATGTFTASRPRSGGRWSVSGLHTEPLPSVPFTTSSDAMATGSDGKPFVAFTGTDSLAVVHLGHKEVELGPTSKCCVEQANLATDGRTGKTWIAYASIITGHMGVFARELTASGRPAGPARLLPGSVTRGSILQPHQRVGATSRGQGNGGVYVIYEHGYPFPRALFLARLPSGGPETVATFGGATTLINATVTTDGNGRLFVGWVLANPPALFVRASNPAGTRFGPIEQVPLPAGTSQVWKVYLSAKAGRPLDVLVLVTLHSNDSTDGYWHTQASPRLP